MRNRLLLYAAYVLLLVIIKTVTIQVTTSLTVVGQWGLLTKINMDVFSRGGYRP